MKTIRNSFLLASFGALTMALAAHGNDTPKKNVVSSDLCTKIISSKNSTFKDYEEYINAIGGDGTKKNAGIRQEFYHVGGWPLFPNYTLLSTTITYSANPKDREDDWILFDRRASMHCLISKETFERFRPNTGVITKKYGDPAPLRR